MGPRWQHRTPSSPCPKNTSRAPTLRVTYTHTRTPKGRQNSSCTTTERERPHSEGRGITRAPRELTELSRNGGIAKCSCLHCPYVWTADGSSIQFAGPRAGQPWHVPRCSSQAIRRHHEQLYVNKLNNLEDMGKFLEAYALPRLNPKQNLN